MPTCFAVRSNREGEGRREGSDGELVIARRHIVAVGDDVGADLATVHLSAVSVDYVSM